VATAADRLRGFRDALREAGLSPAGIAAASGYTREAGREAVRALLAGEHFTALACANDLLAVGALDALREARLRVPQQVSLSGFNDMPLLDLLDPPLTTVRIQHAAMGEQAAALLLAALRGEHSAPRAIRLPPALVLRASTAPPTRP
jgi:LacI family transcriptional regulator